MIDRLEKFLRARLAVDIQLMQEENTKQRYEKSRIELDGEPMNEADIKSRNEGYFKMNGTNMHGVSSQFQYHM